MKENTTMFNLEIKDTTEKIATQMEEVKSEVRQKTEKIGSAVTAYGQKMQEMKDTLSIGNFSS